MSNHIYHVTVVTIINVVNDLTSQLKNDKFCSQSFDLWSLPIIVIFYGRSRFLNVKIGISITHVRKSSKFLTLVPLPSIWQKTEFLILMQGLKIALAWCLGLPFLTALGSFLQAWASTWICRASNKSSPNSPGLVRCERKIQPVMENNL